MAHNGGNWHEKFEGNVNTEELHKCVSREGFCRFNGAEFRNMTLAQAKNKQKELRAAGH